MSPRPITVAVYESHVQAEEAIHRLQTSGFDMKSLSIVGKDFRTEEHAIGFYNAGDRMKVWGKRGAFWGALLGLLCSPAMFLLPGVGHVIVLGPVATAIVGAFEGAALTGSIGALGAALASIGIPKDSIVRYEMQLKAGMFLVVAQGNSGELKRAHEVLHSGAVESATHEG